MNRLKILTARLLELLRGPTPPARVEVSLVNVEVARLNAVAGDMLIVTMPPFADAQRAASVRQSLSEYLTSRLPDGVHVLVWDSGYKAEVLQASSGATS